MTSAAEIIGTRWVEARSSLREIKSVPVEPSVSVAPEIVVSSETSTSGSCSVKKRAVVSFLTRSMTTWLKLPRICWARAASPTRASMSGMVWV